MANKALQSKVQKKFGLADFQNSIEEYYANMTAGKFILCPHENLNALEGAEFEEFDIDGLGTE